MTTGKLGAALMAVGLLAACGGCGGGSNNADNSTANNSANNENNAPNNDNNASNTPNNDTGASWSATLTGLEDQDNMPLPEGGFSGPTVVKTGARLLANNGANVVPQQTFTLELSSGAEFDSTGEKEAGILISWGDPRIECISNLDDKFNPVGGTLNVTGTNPVKGTFEADMDCYIQTDAGTNAVPAQLSGEVEALPGL